MYRGNPGLAESTALLLLAFTGALITTSLVVGLFFLDKVLVAAALASIPLIALFLITSNQRLLCLWGLVLTAPLSLSKHYMPIPHMGGAAAYSIDVSDVFLLPLLFFIMRDRLTGVYPRLRLSFYTFCWVALLALGIPDVVTGPHTHLAGQEQLRLAKSILIFLVILNEAITIGRMLHIAAGLLTGVALESTIGLIQFLAGHNLGLQALGEATTEFFEYGTIHNVAGGTSFRVGALVGHPNFFGGYLALLLPIGIALLFSTISARAKIAICITIGLGLIALAITLSRSSWMSFGVAVMVLITVSFVNPRLRRRYLVARMGVIISMVLAILAFSSIISRRLLESDPSAVDFRWDWMKVAWEMVFERPLFGFGLNTFIYHLPGRTKYGPIEVLEWAFGPAPEWPVVHNIFLIYWSEQGTLGMVFFVGSMLYLLYIGTRNIGRTTDHTLLVLSIGCLSGVIANLCDGFGSFFLRIPAGGRVFAIVAGLLVAAHYQLRANAAERLSAREAVHGATPRVPSPST